MAILIINSGSSSLKVSYFERDKRKDLHLKNEILRPEHLQGLDFSDLKAVGHRVVHGGNFYSSLVLIDEQVIQNLEKVAVLAPLHNQNALDAIKVCQDFFGEDIPEIAGFDTAYFSQMPPVATTYAIPYLLGKRYGIKRFGFHGLSHAFLWQTFVTHGGNSHGKIITLHLGSGCSIAAIDAGYPLDTSMGFTPDEGLVMATRAGDIDASVVGFLSAQEEISVKDVLSLLNEQSGLLGVSGKSPDMETLLSFSKTEDRARLAIDLFVYRIVKYIGGYIAILQGVDALIFSGGIGENSPIIREKIIEGLRIFGFRIDGDANEMAVNIPYGKTRKISAPNSAIAAFVTATDENGYLASEIRKVLV